MQATTTSQQKDVVYTFHRRGAEVARRAHNPEVIRSNRIAGIFQFAGLSESATLSSHHIYPRCGAEEAREAHNFEDIRSKRITGIRSARPQQSTFFSRLQLKKRHHPHHHFRLRRLQLLNIGLSVRTKNKSRLSPPISNHMSKSCLFAFMYLLRTFRFNVRQLVIPFRRRSAYSATYL